MSETADRYISPSGRTAKYDRATFTDDLVVAANFLAWAEDDDAWFGGERASDAFKAVCRMLDLDPIKLRKIAKGNAL